MLITWRARATCIVSHIPTPIHSRVWAAYRAKFPQTKPDLLRTRLFPRSSSLVSIPRAEETPTAKIRSYGLQTRAHAFISRIATADRIFWSRENSDRARPNAEIEISARGTKSKVATREKSPTQLPRLVNAKRGRFKKRISRSNSSSWNNVTEAH